MDREKLIRECLMLTCFLESINPSEKKRIARLLQALYSYSIDELNEYCKVSLLQKELRIDRMLSYHEAN